MREPIVGYAEGFYGKLLTWAERRQILDTLQRLGLTTYYYAPKEDPFHRLYWRAPYSSEWRQEFRAFCAQAKAQGVQVVAGVAPGLDFDFAHLPNGKDFHDLVTKSLQLFDDGALCISLLMDDIDADFPKRCGEFSSEGYAHAALANALGLALHEARGDAFPQSGLEGGVARDRSVANLWVTPRIYADELTATAPDYLPSFLNTLHGQHHVLYCGSDVVAHTLDENSCTALLTGNVNNVETKKLHHRVILWDNLYANDYCPRRLFVGAWQRRSGLQDVLLNPTGMVHTDCLLLELMAEGMKLQAIDETNDSVDTTLWKQTLASHGVPDEFMAIAEYFYHPVFNTTPVNDHVVDSEAVMNAIEYCLWRWKTPLSREWYPAIFGLKHDLLAQAGKHPELRIRKTQNAPLARVLLGKN